MKFLRVCFLLILLVSACSQDKRSGPADYAKANQGNLPASDNKQSNNQAKPLVSETVTKMPPVSDYETQEILGWQVMVSPNVKRDDMLYEPILLQLKADLANILAIVPKHSVKHLQKTTIWVEQGMPIEKLNWTFFNGGKALTKKHGLVPESFGGVIIGNTEGYLAVAGVKPWQMLHELTHAYHQFILKHNYMPVRYAYDVAMFKKLFHPSSDKRIPRKAYATKNQKEYLSVLSVIYFGEKFVYPRNRQELAEHDPVGYCAIVQAWGLVGKQSAGAPLSCNIANQ